MAPSLSCSRLTMFSLVLFLLIIGSANAQLSTNFYSKTCPKLSSIVQRQVQSAISKEARMGASILRLFFHDCFVNGCDGSILLDDTSNFTGEKNALPNRNSVRGFDVIDNIKTAVENICPGVVSCADILAIAATDSVAILGGPTWNVKLGRRDATTASQSAANTAIPAPTSNLNVLTSMFKNVGLSTKDLVALSGAHTIGQARCTTFRARIYNENNIDTCFASTRQSKCPKTSGSGDNNLAPLDLHTPTSFDNCYYRNLVQNKGLLHSDQQLFNGGSTNSIDMSARIADFGIAQHGKSSGAFGYLAPECTTGSANAQLSTNFYSSSCPKLSSTVESTVQSAISNEARMGASILRLFFHDCFVNGCDGSILLDDTSNFTGEKNANPNRNSARGFDVIDNIKTAVENVCPGVVSCADILAIAAADSVAILGGPTWNVKLGRRDAKTASQSAANTAIPTPTSNLNTLTSMFSAVGLSSKDLVTLSGAHTIGQARCTTFRTRIYNETNIDTSFASTRQSNCPNTVGSGDNNLAPLDLQTPTSFDNNYFKNLVQNKGLLHSDQQLFNGGSTNSIVSGYSTNPSSFSSDFVTAMIKMGDISPLTGSNGEIRKNCRKPN